MAITAAGVGSGIDVESIVSQLMALERQPLYNLQSKESTVKAQISAFGSLKSVISSFQDAMGNLGTEDKFKVFSSTSSDEAVLTATSDSTAAAGSYSLDIQRLAQNHKLGSDPIAAGTTFGGTAGDSLTLTVNGNASTIDLSSAQDLEAIRDAINSAGDNPGVTATIINAQTGDQHLVLTADESGYDQRVELSYGGSINATTFNFSTLNQDELGNTLTDPTMTKLDASFTIDGISITSASNEVGNVVDGLSLNLKGIGTASLTVDRDTAAIKQSAQDFVDAYNAVISKISDLKSGSLGNDSSLRGIVSQMHSILNTAATGLSGSYSNLSELGIRTNGKTGKLELDSATFTTALNTDFASVSQVFTDATTGYATRFGALADGLLQTDGLLDNRVNTLDARVKRYEQQQESLNARLDLKEKSLRAQYAALDSLIGSLNTTSAFLTANLANLPG